MRTAFATSQPPSRTATCAAAARLCSARSVRRCDTLNARCAQAGARRGRHTRWRSPRHRHRCNASCANTTRLMPQLCWLIARSTCRSGSPWRPNRGARAPMELEPAWLAAGRQAAPAQAVAAGEAAAGRSKRARGEEVVATARASAKKKGNDLLKEL
eukprot:3060166-Lingulodinium_polyedra.AAC.1